MCLPLRTHCIICCCVDELQLPLCLQLAIEMIMGTPASTKRIGLYFPVKAPDSTFPLRFFVEYFFLTLKKQEYLIHALDSSIGFQPDNTVCTLIVSYISFRSAQIEASRKMLFGSNF